MNLQVRFEKVQNLLEEWLEFLLLEPIRKYPNHSPTNIQPWINSLKKLSIDELVEFENNLIIRSNDSDFLKLLDDIKNLTTFPKFNLLNNNEKLISNKIKEKKSHEIKAIKNLIHPLDEINIIDIGSGAAHLSENLINKKNRNSICIDLNGEFQQRGKKRIHQNNLENSQKIKFLTVNFDESSSINRNRKYKNDIVIGLHACGDLSPDIINFALKDNSKYILSIGCCYHKITTKYNLSSTARLQLSTNAFNLAARTHRIQTKKDLERKIMVRTYRYGLHCYLYSLGHQVFFPIGQTKLSDYELSFGSYAKKYATNLNIKSEIAEVFFNQQEIQNQINDLIYIDIFRGIFGRLIESYLILDRALYLCERGHRVEIIEIFDRKLSPRNLAIFANKIK